MNQKIDNALGGFDDPPSFADGSEVHGLIRAQAVNTRRWWEVMVLQHNAPQRIVERRHKIIAENIRRDICAAGDRSAELKAAYAEFKKERGIL